jgi:glutamine synthetase
MTVETAADRLEVLRQAAAAGAVHTVRVGWPDRLGGWRGKRIPVGEFFGEPGRRIGFCDGMIVVDVHAGITQTTPFSNFETGYPDMYGRPDLGTLRIAQWSPGEAFVIARLESHHGQPLMVAPRNVLESVVERLRATGIETQVAASLTGRLMRSQSEPVTLLPDGTGCGETEPGTLPTALAGLVASGLQVESLRVRADGMFTVRIAGHDAVEAADVTFITKSALKEVARRNGLTATFMTRTPGATSLSQLQLTLSIVGAAVASIDPHKVRGALEDARGLLQPSVNALKAGPPPNPRVRQRGEQIEISGLAASSEADAATAIAVALAAVSAGEETTPASARFEITDLKTAAARLSAASWPREWLGEPFIENTVALLQEEADQFSDAVTDWEIWRYWKQG